VIGNTKKCIAEMFTAANIQIHTICYRFQAMFCTPNIFNGVAISAKIILIEEEQQPGQHFQDRTARRGLTGHIREGPGQDRQERTVSKGQLGKDSQDYRQPGQDSHGS
jgi:hypothetical protein